MEMCYDGALVMPSSYAVMDQDEMTYVDGGMYANLKWYGVFIHLSNRDVNLICKAANTAAGASGVLAVLAQAGIVTAIGSVPAGIVSGALWAGSGALDFMNYLGGEKGLNVRVLWNGMYTILPI